MISTKPEDIRRFLQALDAKLEARTSERFKLVIGGSISVILRGYLTRKTEDVDIPNEVPSPIRALGHDLDGVAEVYDLTIGHFQAHYLPDGWENRVEWWDDLKRMSIYLIDPYDLFVGKLFSRRTKDQQDIRVLVDRMEKAKVVERLQRCQGLLGIPAEREKAEHNWYVLYGEPLPAPPGQEPKH